MTRRDDLMCKDIFGCNHEPETPISDEEGNIVEWRCRCGRRAEAPLDDASARVTKPDVE